MPDHYLVVRFRRSLVELGALSAARQRDIVFEQDPQRREGQLICRVLRRPPPAPLTPAVLLQPIPIDADFEVIGQVAPGRLVFGSTTRYEVSLQVPVTKICFALERRPHIASQVEWERIQRALHSVAARVPGGVHICKLYESVPDSDGGGIRIAMRGERAHVGNEPDGYPVFDAGGQAVWVDAAHPELITNVALRAIFKIRCRRLSGDIDNDGDSVFQLRTELVHLAYV